MNGLRFFIRQEGYFGQLDQYNSIHELTMVPEYARSLISIIAIEQYYGFSGILRTTALVPKMGFLIAFTQIS